MNGNRNINKQERIRKNKREKRNKLTKKKKKKNQIPAGFALQERQAAPSIHFFFACLN